MAKIMPAHVPVHIEPVGDIKPPQVALHAEGGHAEPVKPAAVDPYLARSVKSSPNGF